VLPVVTGVDFGQTGLIWTIPQDTRVRIDPDHETITFLETAVD
jgi:muramoyltetrapeptide carboxypeptidase LdcA involved in peptidoglycan recycling